MADMSSDLGRWNHFGSSDRVPLHKVWMVENPNIAWMKNGLPTFEEKLLQDIDVCLFVVDKLLLRGEEKKRTSKESDVPVRLEIAPRGRAAEASYTDVISNTAPLSKPKV